MLHGEGIGGVIFLCLYCINFSILIYGYTTKRIVFKSVFTFLLMHVLLRLAAQSVAIALGSKPSIDFGLLIAFFVLGAEGYFSLVLCAYRFLIHHHQHTYPISGSFLEGNRTKADSQLPWYKRFKRAMTGRDSQGHKDPWVMTWIHWLMICANTIIIVGGTRVNGSEYGEPDYFQDLYIAGILRAVGQAIFLVINLFLFNFLLISRNQDKSSTGAIPRAYAHFFRVSPEHGQRDVVEGKRDLGGYAPKMHPMLKVLFLAWPPLIVRGIFGLLQAQVNAVNYANIDVYTYGPEGGVVFARSFVICENVLAVLPEWTACCLLCTCMFTRDTFDPKALEGRTQEEDVETPGSGTDQRTLGGEGDTPMEQIKSKV